MATLNKCQYDILVNKGFKAQNHSLNGFAEACYDDGNFEELAIALDSAADTTDCKNWDISAEEWKESIKKALEAAMYWHEDEMLNLPEQGYLTTEQDRMVTTKQQKEVMIKDLLMDGTKRELQARFNLDSSASIDDIKNEIRRIRNVTEFVVQMIGNKYYIYNSYPKMIISKKG